MTISAPAVLSTNKNGTGTGGLLLQTRELKATALKNAKGAKRTASAYEANAAVSEISMHVPAGEVVILSGGSRAARSLLLRTLAGLNKPAGGDLLLDGVELYPNRKVFAAYIGYVPAGLDLAESLTVQETLRYAARMRLPRGTPNILRTQRVSDLMEGFGLQPAAGTRLSRLDPFQRRLVSVAVELISAPRLLLIEESSEGLEPADEVRLVRLLKQLARPGPTIVLAAGATRCAQIADKLVVLASNGELAWFGPGGEGLAYFRSLTPRPRTPTGASPATTFGLEDVQETMASQAPANGEIWNKGFQALPAYATYVDDPLNDRHPDLLLVDRPLSQFRGAAKEKTPPPRIPQVSGITKFNLLAWRNNRQVTRERTGLALLLAPPLVALLDLLLSSPTMNDPTAGDPAHAPIALGLVTFLVMLLTALLFSNEIVKERAIYQRERRILSLALPYALSKAWLVFLVAVYSGLVWAVVHTFAAGFEANLLLFPYNAITLFLVALTGGMLGLVASSLARTRAGAVILALALVIPQLLLSGSILPLSRLPAPLQMASAATPARYGFESLLTLSGYGWDIAADSCWRLSASQRNELTPQQKSACTCLGENLVSQCSFPGIRKVFTFVIEQPMPPPPDRQASNYVTNLEQYSAALANWTGNRSSEIGRAEGIISLAVEQYGQAFRVTVSREWQILAVMSFALLLLIIALQLRKGVST